MKEKIAEESKRKKCTEHERKSERLDEMKKGDI